MIISRTGQKKRILCFCEQWESGGIESFLSNLYLNMLRSDLDIDICVSAISNSVYKCAMENAGIHFFQLSGSTHKLFANYRAFRRILKSHKYDVVHLNIYHGMSLYYAKIAKQMGVPSVLAHSHNAGLRKSCTRWIKLLIHRIYSALFTSKADKLLACSKQAAEFMFPQKILHNKDAFFVPNGIDMQRFAYCQKSGTLIKRQFGIENKYVIGCVGRLCYQKNQLFMLEVMSLLLEKSSDIVLLLVGEGDDLNILKNYAERLNRKAGYKAVIFAGVTDRVEDYYSAMDVLAFPSRFEGLGIAAIEAQANGLYTIISPYVPDEVILTDYLCKLELESSLWAEKICEIPRGRRYAVPRTITDQFDITKVAQAMKDMYQSNSGIGEKNVYFKTFKTS